MNKKLEKKCFTDTKTPDLYTSLPEVNWCYHQ